MTDKLKIGVGLPAYGGQLDAEHARMWLYFGNTLAASAERFEHRFFLFVDGCGVDKARSLIMDHAVEQDCDWVLMIDADTWVDDSRDLLVMISEADRAGAAIVCAPVRRRRVGEGPSELMAYRYDHLGRMIGIQLDPLPDDEPSNAPFVILTAGCATACIAIKVSHDAVRGLDKPWFRFTTALSEDLDFCARVQRRGGKVLCDPRVKTFHRARPAVLASHP